MSGCDSDRWKKVATPMLWAKTVTAGRYLTPPHILALDRAVTDTLRGTDGVRRLMVMMPPRHGKSEYCSLHLPAWYLGAFPQGRVILSSYNEQFAATRGRKTRNLLEEHGRNWFGVSVDPSSSAANRWDIAGHGGGMVTAGAGGTMTGLGADLMIVDDPHKNSEEAHSRLMRDKVWEWWQATAYTRLEPGAAAIVIQTRWHKDDLCGRLLREMADGGEQWRILKLPAIGNDGAALWPARYPIETLQQMRRTMGTYYFSALYQQEPIPDGGEFFQRDWFHQIVDALPAGCRRAVRYWDTANSVDGDYTVGALVTECDGIHYISDVKRFRKTWKERNQVIMQTAELDGQKWRDLQLWAEAQRGDSGGQVYDLMTREFARFALRMDRPTQSKELRARPFQAACEAGNVRLLRGKWNSEWIDEMVSFPHGEHDDQVDATSGAFLRLKASQSGGSFKPRYGGR